MSELQLGLLVIGIVVALGVYGYGLWQQRMYRRKFGTVFESRQPDALATARKTVGPVARNAADVQEPVLDLAALVEGTGSERSITDGICELIDGKTDYLACFKLSVPRHCDYLLPLWDKRFVYGKNLNVCGRNAVEGRWERVVPECVGSYVEFRIGLQLVDRSGPASQSRLAGFHELMQQIALQGGELDIDPVETAQRRARELDEFCARTDRTIGLNIVIREGRNLFASELAGILQLLGFTLQADGSFQLLDTQGETLFTVIDCAGGKFQHHTMNQMRITCLTLLLDVPRVLQPVARFEEMALLARKLSDELKGVLRDDNRRELGESAIAQITAEVRKIEAEMLAGGIVPGSPQALRLYS